MGVSANSSKMKKDKPAITSSHATAKPTEVQKLLVFERALRNLLREDRYIARSDYREILEGFREAARHLEVIRNSGVLPEYCRKHSIDIRTLECALSNYGNIEGIVERHNSEFIAKFKTTEKEYLDNILKDIDPNILLDDNQREVVLTDEDYCLVIAGAGAGKTTTVAAKVKYLVDRRHIRPDQILVISFTNKAVEELRGKINKALSIDCPITTFHSAGNAIIRKQVD